MTNRERAMGILRYQSVDRMPAVHFGYWRELLAEWAEQGHIAKELVAAWGDGNQADRELDRLLGWDFNWSRTVRCKGGLMPAFENTVLEELPDGTKRVLTEKGVIERIKPGLCSIPSEDDYLLKGRKEWEELFLPKLQFSPDRLDIQAIKKRVELLGDEAPVGLHVGSVMGEIRDITTVMGMSYLMYDEDETLFAEIVDTYAELQYQCVKAMLELGIRFDFAHYWEDICFKSGPLLHPELFDELCAKHYKKRNELLRSHGIDLISLDCDGVTEKLQRTWLENGVNILFPIEIGVWGDQFEAARARFGTEQRGVGGMDKTALRKDKAAVDAELERMQRMAELGGFIPCPDHRLMPGTKFELVQYYAEKIKELRL